MMRVIACLALVAVAAAQAANEFMSLQSRNAEAFIRRAPTFAMQAARRISSYPDVPHYLSQGSDDVATYGPVIELPGFGKTAEVQYAGYVNIEEATGSNLFYWMFDALKATPSEAPLVIWLQGGPGGSSLFGLFAENGPYTVNDDLTLKANPYSWHNHNNLLFVDNPVGTGFSYTTEKTRYVSNEAQVADDFIAFLNGFFKQHPQYRSNPLFITGESYGGKYVPSIANRILQWNLENPSAADRINLQGVAIGDGWTHPTTQVRHYTDQAFATGLLDERQKKVADLLIENVVNLIEIGGEYLPEAANMWNDAAEFIQTAGGGFSPYDVRDFSGEDDSGVLCTSYLARPEVHKALYVSPDLVWSGDSGKVADALQGDIMVSALHNMPDLLRSIRVLIYNGQFDWICNLIGVEAMYREDLDWPEGRDAYLAAERAVWHVTTTGPDGKERKAVAGFARSALSLTQVIVNNAGHMVPMNQPANAADMIQRFIRNQKFD